MRRSFKVDPTRARLAGRYRLPRLLAAFCVVALAACAATPPVHYYTLIASERPTPREGAPAPGRGPAIVLEPIRVPSQVDQAQWLLHLPDGTLALLEQERWASPLRDELNLALREILTQRFGAIDGASPATGLALWRIRVEVTRFESWPGEARFESTWTVTPRGREASGLRCTSYFRETAVGGMVALADAHRRAVERLGDAIGEQLLALQRGESGHCPSES